jgi:hypothetical protein
MRIEPANPASTLITVQITVTNECGVVSVRILIPSRNHFLESIGGAADQTYVGVKYDATLHCRIETREVVSEAKSAISNARLGTVLRRDRKSFGSTKVTRPSYPMRLDSHPLCREPIGRLLTPHLGWFLIELHPLNAA